MEPREMTAEELECAWVAMERFGFTGTVVDLKIHIAALTARAERAEHERGEMRAGLAEALRERDEWRCNAETERAHRERQVAELSAKVEATRDAALEEAATLLASDGMPVVREMQHSIRALKSQPARRFVDAEYIRVTVIRVAERRSEMAAQRFSLDPDGAASYADGWAEGALAVGKELKP